jgi:hypothetical protein
MLRSIKTILSDSFFFVKLLFSENRTFRYPSFCPLDRSHPNYPYLYVHLICPLLSMGVNMGTMIITVDTPVIRCTRCGTEGQQGPLLIQLASNAGRGAHPPGFTARDDRDREWYVLTADKPAGWVTPPWGPGEVCYKCMGEWTEYVKAFARDATERAIRAEEKASIPVVSAAIPQPAALSSAAAIPAPAHFAPTSTKVVLNQVPAPLPSTRPAHRVQATPNPINQKAPTVDTIIRAPAPRAAQSIPSPAGK